MQSHIRKGTRFGSAENSKEVLNTIIALRRDMTNLDELVENISKADLNRSFLLDPVTEGLAEMRKRICWPEIGRSTVSMLQRKVEMPLDPWQKKY